MEKSRAIDLLDNLIGMIEDNQDNDYDTAFRMAIEALKAQLSREGTTKDAISRQQALDIFDDYNVSVENGELEAYSRDRKRLCDLPPIQPEPKEGHWIGCDGSYICSECNVSPIDFIGTMGISFDAYVETPMNYCLNCGAKMKGADT